MIGQIEEVDVNVVGSSSFGLYSKISDERTYNMFESDGWLTNYGGYRKQIDIAGGGVGRGLYHSVRGNFMLTVVSQAVYVIKSDLTPEYVGSLSTSNGELSMDENLSGQICISDGIYLYIYNDSLKLLTRQDTGIVSLVPNYVCYHNSRFLIGNANASADGAKWYVFQFATPTTIEIVPVGGELALESKPDVALAAVRLPGKANNIIVFGSTVADLFAQVGGQLNYQRNSSINIDYGVVNVHTIAASDEIVCWLAQNENNAPVLMITTGGAPQPISGDGINGVLGNIKFPQQSTAFFYKQDGHLFYQITFYNPEDNLTLTYDFTVKKFYHLSDERLCYHPIRHIVYFDNKIFGISINDAGLYQIDSSFTTYNYGGDDVEIPRIRICKAIRIKNAQRFIATTYSMWLEQGADENYTGIIEANPCGNIITEGAGEPIITEEGQDIVVQNAGCLPYAPRVDISISKNGGVSYSNIISKRLNQYGKYKNQFTINQLGMANELIIQLRFWTRSRVIAGNGTMKVMT